MEKLAVTLVVLVLLTVGVDAISAQDPLIPAEIPGEVVFIPFPTAITVDGDLSDWATVPSVMLTKKAPAFVPSQAVCGAFSFQLAADETHLYFAVSVDRPALSPGESSFDLYVNLTSDMHALVYTAGIAQLVFSPTRPTVTGINSERMQIDGQVFATTTGWGVEAAVPLDRIFVADDCETCRFPPPQDNTPFHGRAIGLQAIGHAETPDGVPIECRWAMQPALSGEPPSPATFGRGIYFEAGRSDIPWDVEPAPPPAQAIPTIDWAGVRDALVTVPAPSSYRPAGH